MAAGVLLVLVGVALVARVLRGGLVSRILGDG